MRTKSETRRQAIVDVAREVFQDCGFESASMSQIAAHLGGSKATLYSYFNSKEELFAEVTHQFAADHFHEIFATLDANAEVTPTLQSFGQRFLNLICRADLLAAHRNLFAEANKSEIGKIFYERGPLCGLKMISSYLEQCMALGKFRASDPFVGAQQLIALLKAEIFDKLLFGLDTQLTSEDLALRAQRAVDTFVRAYAVK